MMTFRFLSRQKNSDKLTRHIPDETFTLWLCFDCPWSDNTYKSAKSDIFPQRETVFPQVLERPGIWKVSWKVLEFYTIFIVYNQLLPNCYVRYSQVFSLFIYLFLELKKEKMYCNLLSHDYFLFAFDRKCLKIIAFSRPDGLKMNGSSIGLGKKRHLHYAIIALKMSLLPV